MSRWSAVHYNALAKELREEMQKVVGDYVPGSARKPEQLAAMSALCNLVLRLARRFVSDNPAFDPLLFLDRCSPDTDLYPLSELWEDDQEARVIQVEG